MAEALVLPDPADDEFIGRVVKAVARLMVAVELGEPLPIVGELAQLLNLLTEHRNAPAERPSDAVLRRAIARLG